MVLTWTLRQILFGPHVIHVCVCVDCNLITIKVRVGTGALQFPTVPIFPANLFDQICP